MRKLTATICLTLTLLLGSAGCSNNASKGWSAAQSGDYATALREWTPLAEQGDADAQFNLGVMYHKGRGVPQNHKTAVKWYRLAAEQRNAVAQSNLGVMYEKGHGVTQDNKTALKWYTLAADQGDAYAQSNLGWMYEKGQGVPQDYKTAVKWYRLSAEQENAIAKNNLRILLKSPGYTDALKKQNAEKTRGERERLRETCSGFGFKDGSKEMSTCMFELYKLEKSKSQTRTVIQNNTGDGSAVRALIEEQRRAAEAQRKAVEAQQGIDIMRQGLEMMRPRQQNNSDGFRIGPNGGMWNCRNGICSK